MGRCEDFVPGYPEGCWDVRLSGLVVKSECIDDLQFSPVGIQVESDGEQD